MRAAGEVDDATDDFLVGLIVLLLGAAVCFFGLRLFFSLLPLWGFLVGFFVGAAGIEALFGDGLLATGTGWIAGFIVGVVFALLSYIFWYVGAILAAASAGALVGSALMSALNVDASWVVFLVALAGAILFGGWGRTKFPQDRWSRAQVPAA